MNPAASLGPELGTIEDGIPQASYARTLSWLSNTENNHPNYDLGDIMDYNLESTHVRLLPKATVLPIPPSPLVSTQPDSQDFQDNMSQFSEIPDIQTVRQNIVQAAKGTIGRCFLNCYNRASPWVSILQLKSPQPVHTITAIQKIGSQAEAVLQMLFSLDCLPGNTGDVSETDLLSASYSSKLW